MGSARTLWQTLCRLKRLQWTTIGGLEGEDAVVDGGGPRIQVRLWSRSEQPRLHLPMGARARTIGDQTPAIPPPVVNCTSVKLRSRQHHLNFDCQTLSSTNKPRHPRAHRVLLCRLSVTNQRNTSVYQPPFASLLAANLPPSTAHDNAFAPRPSAWGHSRLETLLWAVCVSRAFMSSPPRGRANEQESSSSR